MKTLPNGLKVFNATPHPITFWEEGWGDVVVVDSDEVINAKAVESPASCFQPMAAPDGENVWLVNTTFSGNEYGYEIIARAKGLGADVIIGSILAAQAYPGQVVAMTPAKGFERVPVPLPGEVLIALNQYSSAAWQAGLLDEAAEADRLHEKYAKLPTKRMSASKFTVFN